MIGKSSTLQRRQPILFAQIRLVVVPGMTGLIIPWLIETGIGKFVSAINGGHNFNWAERGQIPFLHVPVLQHWDEIAAFAVAGAISAVYGMLVGNSPRQRYVAAFFPVAFEILKWSWLLRYPLNSWIDPYREPYRFMSLPASASIGYWLIHILLPGAAAMGAVWCSNRWFSVRAASASNLQSSI